MATKNVYSRTAKQNNKQLKGQALLVMDALENAKEPQTVEQLTATIKDAGLVTRQAPERITSYYLCIFKKQGLVKVEAVDADEASNEEVELEDEEAVVE